jgi:penicillin-binding protein 1A
MAFEIGLPRVVSAAERLGFPGPLPELPALVLGGVETTPLAVAETYAVLASQGQRTTPRAVKQVANEDDQLIEGRPLAIASVVSPQTSYLVTHLLEGAIDRGTAMGVRARGFARPAAGKTGTTNDYGDAWFAGYTPDLVAIVWVGFDRRKSLGLSGAGAALPIWTAFMHRATAGRPVRGFEAAAGVALVRIDPTTGLRATRACPDTIVEAFLDEDAPLEQCARHADARTVGAPPAAVGERRSEEHRAREHRSRESWWRRLFTF